MSVLSEEEVRISHDMLFKELLSMFFFEFVDLFLPQMGEYLDRSEITFLFQFHDSKVIDILIQTYVMLERSG